MNTRVLRTARDRDAEANLEAFIAKGKKSGAFGEVCWDDPVWKGVALSKHKRASAGRTGPKDLFFTTGKGQRGAIDTVAMSPPFVDFVKALLRLREDASPRHVELHRIMIRACRYLHNQLGGDAYDPCRLVPAHFDAAAKEALARETETTAYGTGKFLAEIAEWTDSRRISRVRIGWRNKIPRPTSDERFGAEAERRRASKLPSQAALDTLPQIANRPLDDPDLLRMRVIELLVCGGFRINELLSIPADCEAEELAFENGAPVVGPDGRQVVRYGIRYFAEKGFGPSVKWIPTAMVDVAKRALADVRRITDPVRADARWMRSHPSRVNVLELAVGDMDELISITRLTAIIGLARKGLYWVNSHGIPTFKDPDSQTGRGFAVRRGDVCAAIIGDIPIVPSSYPVRLEDHMFLIRDNFNHRARPPVNGSVRVLVDSMVRDFIAGHDGMQSVFEMHGFAEPDGSKIVVTTHQFRHWLNTLAQEGGMRQELIARWSGRKEMAQNAAYDHVSGRHLAQKVRGMVEQGAMKGPIDDVARRLAPADRDGFLGAQIATAHVTDVGLCVHDWSLAPCPTHGECANCNEHVVDKGNERQRVEAERQLGEVEHMLETAETERAGGTCGAARWVEAHRHKRDGLRAIIAVHGDESIAEGTLVHTLRGPSMSDAAR